MPSFNALALQLAETLDAGRLERHELAGLRVKGCNPLQPLHLFPLEHLRSVHGVKGDVVLHCREIDGLIAQHIDVRDRCARALRTRIHAGDLLVQDLGDRAPDGVVRPRRSARADVEELLFSAGRVPAAAADEQRCGECGNRTRRKDFLYGRNVHGLFLLYAIPTSSKAPLPARNNVDILTQSVPCPQDKERLVYKYT